MVSNYRDRLKFTALVRNRDTTSVVRIAAADVDSAERDGDVTAHYQQARNGQCNLVKMSGY